MFRKNSECKNPPASFERQKYLASKRRVKSAVLICQLSLLVAFVALWEISARLGAVDSFVMSMPSRMAETVMNFKQNNLVTHVLVTCWETVAGFALGTVMGAVIAVILWWSNFLSKVSEPFLVVLNSLPKVALGPVIIIWVGAGTQAIIVMALAISLIVTVLEMLNGFNKASKEKIKMVQTFGASRMQIFTKVVFPSNLATLFNALKINIGLSLVGVISGEFLVSKAGLGYLIVYGGQVFQMDLVMTAVVILAVVAALMYKAVVIIEKHVMRAVSHSK